MANITPLFYFLSGLPKSDVYVETGTYRGDNLRNVVGKFAKVISIELDLGWYEFNAKYFQGRNDVILIHGDSSLKLAELDFEPTDCITYYLDAHYSGPGTAFGKKETPLLEELDAIKSRLNRKSLVIIDDIHQLGKVSAQPGDGLQYWDFQSDWSDITLDEIKARLPINFKTLENKQRWASTGKRNQLVCFHTTNFRFSLIRLYDKLGILHNRLINKVINYLIKILGRARLN